MPGSGPGSGCALTAPSAARRPDRSGSPSGSTSRTTSSCSHAPPAVAAGNAVTARSEVAAPPVRQRGRGRVQGRRPAPPAAPSEGLVLHSVFVVFILKAGVTGKEPGVAGRAGALDCLAGEGGSALCAVVEGGASSARAGACGGRSYPATPDAIVARWLRIAVPLLAVVVRWGFATTTATAAAAATYPVYVDARHQRISWGSDERSGGGGAFANAPTEIPGGLRPLTSRRRGDV